MLGIPTVLDRMIQQALLQVLTPLCTEPYARWCGSWGRVTAPSYPMVRVSSFAGA